MSALKAGVTTGVSFVHLISGVSCFSNGFVFILNPERLNLNQINKEVAAFRGDGIAQR